MINKDSNVINNLLKFTMIIIFMLATVFATTVNSRADSMDNTDKFLRALLKKSERSWKNIRIWQKKVEKFKAQLPKLQKINARHDAIVDKKRRRGESIPQEEIDEMNRLHDRYQAEMNSLLASLKTIEIAPRTLPKEIVKGRARLQECVKSAVELKKEHIKKMAIIRNMHKKGGE